MQDDSKSIKYPFRLTQAERERMVKAASRQNVSASHFIRAAVKHLASRPDWEQKAIIETVPRLLPGQKPKLNRRKS